MSFGGLTNVGHFGSSAVMNQKLNHALTGSEIAGLLSTQKKKGMQILCTLTESGFTANHLYIIAADDTTVLDMGLIDHEHTNTNDGGTLYNILRYNAGLNIFVENTCPSIGFFNEIAVGSGGTVVDSGNTNGGILISTNATSGAHATAAMYGVSPTYTLPSHFKVKLQLTSSTNFTQCRIGIRQEHANESNTTLAKYGMEACSSSGVNWLINSSDGTTRTTVSTSSAAATGQQDCYTLDHTITTLTAIKSTATAMASKTSNMPNTAVTSGTQFFRTGLKNTAAENKALALGAIRVQGFSAYTSWCSTAPLT